MELRERARGTVQYLGSVSEEEEVIDGTVGRGRSWRVRVRKGKRQPGGGKVVWNCEEESGSSKW